MTSGDGRTVTYTAFDKPESIVKGTNTATFAYGPDRARFKRTDVATSGTTTTHYVGGKAYEVIAAPGGTVTQKHYIGDFAVVTKVVGSPTSDTTDYLHRDHLGSVDTVTDVSGEVVQRMSFDAWGRRREENWQPSTDNAIAAYDTSITRRGFTNHEMIDTVGLVHMNGRVYDPTLGRFLSADPHVQAPHNFQNWNRYSYVLNKPLSYTDPTGFFFKKLFRSIGNAINGFFKTIGSALKVALRSSLVRAVIQVAGCIATNIYGCAAIAASMTLAAGGSVLDALKTAAFAFAQMQTFQVVGTLVRGAHTLVQASVHGVVSGAINLARGGNFLQGFAGGFIGKIGSVLTRGFENAALRTGVAAAFGCAGASLSGGKCVNGAVTAAYAHLYNEMGEGDNPRIRIGGNDGPPLDDDDVSWFRFAIRGAARTLFAPLMLSGSARRPEYHEGDFDIQSWEGYPDELPRPSGPFRLIRGQNYASARGLADATNQKLRKLWQVQKGCDIHEIYPIRFNGSPTDLNNKMVLPKGFHSRVVTPWWTRIQRKLQKNK